VICIKDNSLFNREVRSAMVTRIVVLRRKTPAERASAADDSNGCDDNDKLHHRKRNDDFDDDDDDDDENHYTSYVKKGSLNRSKAADGGFCGDHSRSDNDVGPNNNNAATVQTTTTTNMVTHPFTIELVDDIPFATLPTIANSTSPPKMKKMGRNGTNPFTLPIKKRFVTNAAQKKNPPPSAYYLESRQDDRDVVRNEEELKQQHQQHVSSSTVTAATTTNNGGAATGTTLRREDSSSSSTITKKKKYRKPQCSHPSCPNRVMNRGVCARHGAHVRTCSISDCTKYAQKGGVCIRHGAVKEYKRCVVEGCNSRPVGKEVVCARHVGVEVPTTTSGGGGGVESGKFSLCTLCL
jgi:hypothetical protein